MEIRTSGIHHLAIRVTDYERAKHFYIDTLGFKKIMEQPGLCLFLAGSTPIGILGSENKTYVGDQFDPYRVGLDHLAIGCENKQDLQAIAEALMPA